MADSAKLRGFLPISSNWGSSYATWEGTTFLIIDRLTARSFILLHLTGVIPVWDLGLPSDDFIDWMRMLNASRMLIIEYITLLQFDLPICINRENLSFVEQAYT